MSLTSHGNGRRATRSGRSEDRADFIGRLNFADAVRLFNHLRLVFHHRSPPAITFTPRPSLLISPAVEI